MHKKHFTPTEIWREQHEYVRRYDAEGQAHLLAEDVVWELPFAPESVPRRVKGKAQVMAMAKAGMEGSKKKGNRIVEYKDLIIYETNDPEVIIAEFVLVGLTGENASYSIPYIQVVRVRDGKIVHLKDYFPGEVISKALEK